MTLHELERAIRPQFSWVHNSKKLLQVDTNYEESPAIGEIVFIGIAHSISIAPEDTAAYLRITPSAYSRKLAQFFQYYNEAQVINRRANPLRYCTRLYTKTHLTINALRTLCPSRAVQIILVSR